MNNELERGWKGLAIPLFMLSQYLPVVTEDVTRQDTPECKAVIIRFWDGVGWSGRGVGIILRLL
jgi:hypothetical protein